MIEIIKAAFMAGEVKTFLIQGEYLEILEAAYPVDVAMMDRSGAQLSTMRNAEASYFSRPGKYEVIQVTSPNAQTIRLFVGSGDAGTRRTSGVVEITDASKSRTKANRAFAAGSSIAGLAGNYACAYLFNPAGSGVLGIVNNLAYSSDMAQTIVVASGTGQPPATMTMFEAANKYAGSAVFSNLKKYEGVATAGPVFGSALFASSVQASSASGPLLTEPIVLPENTWLLVYGGTMGASLQVSRQFFQEPI